MSTPSERLEAEIWLEESGQHLSDLQRQEFFVHIDTYYQQNPTAARGSDVLGVLRDDDAAFSGILEAVCPQVAENRVDADS